MTLPNTPETVTRLGRTACFPDVATLVAEGAAQPRRLLFASFAGLDESAPFEEVVAFALAHEKALFGLLLGRDQLDGGSSPRYPGLAWLHRIVTVLPPRRLALHVCGRLADRAMTGDIDPALVALLPHVSIVQMNFRELPGSDAAMRDGLAAVARAHGGGVLMLPQVRLPGARERVAAVAAAHPPFALGALLDPSGGRGERPWLRPPAIPGLFCGQAGGIRPATIEDDARETLASGAYFVDMESGIRSHDDVFDLDACGQVMRRLAPFL